MEPREEALKRQIKALFAKVKKGQQEQVLKALQGLKSNEDRLSYLKGWTQFD